MAYAGDKLLLERNDLLILNTETTEGTDPGSEVQGDVVPFETFSLRDAKETIQPETVRGSRTKNRKVDTIWNVEGEVEMLYRGGGINGADSATAILGGAETHPEGMQQLLAGHFGAAATEFDGSAMVAGSTASLIKLAVGGGADYQKGDLIIWTNDGTDIFARFVQGVSTDDVSVWPDIEAANIPTDAGVAYSRAQYRLATTATLHPSMFGKAALGFVPGGNAMIHQFGGIKVPEMNVDFPLADFAKFRFGLRGQRNATDPAHGVVPGSLTHPRNPNGPVLGLENSFMYYSNRDGNTYAVCPLTVSFASTHEVHPITCLTDANTPSTHRLGMRDVTAVVEVIYDDAAIAADFRQGDHIALLQVAGFATEFSNAAWTKFGFNAFAIGSPRMTIDSVEPDSHEDTKKLTLNLVAEPSNYGLSQANQNWGWDQELSLACAGSGNV